MKICERHTNTHATISDRCVEKLPKAKRIKNEERTIKKKGKKATKQTSDSGRQCAEKPTKTFEESNVENVEPKAKRRERRERVKPVFFLIICTRFLRRFAGWVFNSVFFRARSPWGKNGPEVDAGVHATVIRWGDRSELILEDDDGEIFFVDRH